MILLRNHFAIQTNSVYFNAIESSIVTQKSVYLPFVLPVLSGHTHSHTWFTRHMRSVM